MSFSLLNVGLKNFHEITGDILITVFLSRCNRCTKYTNIVGTLTGAVGELHKVIQIYITYKYLIVSETKLKFMVYT